MGRFFNRECAGLAAAVFAGILGLCLLAKFDAGKAVLWSAALTAICFIPLAVVLQEFLLNWYEEHGSYDRGLDLAIQIRDAALNAKMRNYATANVAGFQFLKRDFRGGLTNLEKIRTNLFKEPTDRAVVDGLTAYALAHLNDSLERAEELARSAARAVPGEGLFDYYVGLVLFKRGQLDEAERFITASLEKNKDQREPFPNERAETLAQLRAAKVKPA